MEKQNKGILIGLGLIAVVATSLLLGFGFTPAKEYMHIDEAVKLVERFLELEKKGAWEEWVENIVIRSYPEIGYVYERNDLLASSRPNESPLADYEILNVEYLETWSTRPTRPWIESKGSRYENFLYEEYRDVVRVEVRLVDIGPGGNKHSYVENHYVVRNEQGELKIHWSPWFAFNG